MMTHRPPRTPSTSMCPKSRKVHRTALDKRDSLSPRPPFSPQLRKNLGLYKTENDRINLLPA